MKRVGILLPYPGYINELFEKAKKEIGYNEDIEILFSSKNRIEILEKSDAVISGPMPEKELGQAKNLKLIQVPFAGVDGFDLHYIIEKRSITLANVHGNALSVAEHAFGLMLSLAKGIVRNDIDLRRGYWHGWMSKEPNIELEGKTVCIIGLGSIGRAFAKFAKAFGMNVIGVKKTVQNVENVDKVFSDKETETAIKDAQFIVIAVPTTEETKGFINTELLNKMKGKFLINVARGNVINEEALFVVLKNRILQGAAIDTWWVYPEKPYEYKYPSHYPFWVLDNIIMSCHTAGYSDGSIRKNWEEATKNVVRFLAGKPVKNIISIKKGY
jgi:phosphoglycerate dehydrogenase-like enzyme